MSTEEQQTYDIEEYWPTAQWLEVYRENLEESEELTEKGEGWGVGWEGRMIFHIHNIPTDQQIQELPEELVTTIEETIQDLSKDRIEELVSTAPQDVQEDFKSRSGSPHERATAMILETPIIESPERISNDIREELPEVIDKLLEQVEENIVEGDTVYAWLDLYDGGCREVDVLDSLNERDHGFVIIGEYQHWKQLVEGNANVIDQIMAGEMEVDGDMQKILQYSDAAVTMTEISADTRSRFLF